MAGYAVTAISVPLLRVDSDPRRGGPGGRVGSRAHRADRQGGAGSGEDGAAGGRGGCRRSRQGLRRAQVPRSGRRVLGPAHRLGRRGPHRGALAGIPGPHRSRGDRHGDPRRAAPPRSGHQHLRALESERRPRRPTGPTARGPRRLLAGLGEMEPATRDTFLLFGTVRRADDVRADQLRAHLVPSRPRGPGAVGRDPAGVRGRDGGGRRRRGRGRLGVRPLGVCGALRGSAADGVRPVAGPRGQRSVS